MGGKGRRYLRRLGVDEAQRLFLDATRRAGAPPAERVAVPEALGRVTAVAVPARQPAPFYHSSAMDGLAVAAEATFAASGASPVRLGVPRDAAWVDTGDPIPEGRSAVIPSEELHWRDDGSVEIHAPAAPWDNVRVTGQEIATGEMVVPSGWRLGPADLGSLLAAGVTEVEVARRPRVAVLPTGSELIRPGAPLEVGKVLEFNSEIAAGLVREQGGGRRSSPRFPTTSSSCARRCARPRRPSTPSWCSRAPRRARRISRRARSSSRGSCSPTA